MLRRAVFATPPSRVSQAGRATYSARVGKHDDLVLAVALCTWWASVIETSGEYSLGLYSPDGGGPITWMGAPKPKPVIDPEPPPWHSKVRVRSEDEERTLLAHQSIRRPWSDSEKSMMRSMGYDEPRF
jgi:hypothetical protein